MHGRDEEHGGSLMAQLVDRARRRLPRAYLEVGQELDEFIRTEMEEDPGILRSDAPARHDALQFRRLSDQEFSTLTQPLLQTPIALCIEGPWGTGKSTFMHFIYDLINDRNRQHDDRRPYRWLPIWIDLSALRTANEVLPVVARSVHEAARNLANKIATTPELGPCEWELWADEPPSAPFRGMRQQLTGERPVYVPWTIRRLVRRDANRWLQDWGSIDQDVWTIDRFIRMLKEIRWGLLGRLELGRVFLFVDDLDRCAEDVILEVLHLHRALLDTPGIVLTYAMEYHVVSRIVGKQISSRLAPAYGDHSDTAVEVGIRYLEKFFTKRIKVPEPAWEALVAWMMKLLDVQQLSDTLLAAVNSGMNANPRRLKRFANTCREILSDDVAMAVLRATKKIDETALRELVYKVVAFALGWPTEYANLPHPKAESILEMERRARNQNQTDERAPGYGLTLLLTCDPELKDHRELLGPLMRFCEPYVGEAAYRGWGAGTQEPIIFPEVAKEQQVSDAANGDSKDAAKVRAVLSGWAGNTTMEGAIKIIFTGPIPPRALKYFRDEGFEPSSELLIQKAQEAFRVGDAPLGKWLALAFVLHPDAEPTGLEFLLLEDQRETEVVTFVAELVAFMAVHHGMMSPTEMPFTSHELRFAKLMNILRSDNREAMEKAVGEALEYLGVSQEEQQRDPIPLPNDFPLDWVMLASDLFNKAKNHAGGMRLMRGALNTPLGRRSVMLRNYARACQMSGDVNTAHLAYRAALVAEPANDQAAWWYSGFVDRHRDQLDVREGLSEDLELVAVYLDQEDPKYWYQIGLRLAQDDRFEDALPWLQRALQLAPDNRQFRVMLSRVTRDAKSPEKASEVLRSDFFPAPDITPCLQVAHDALVRVVKEIMAAGPITLEGKTFFDPGSPSAWVSRLLAGPESDDENPSPGVGVAISPKPKGRPPEVAAARQQEPDRQE